MDITPNSDCLANLWQLPSVGSSSKHALTANLNVSSSGFGTWHDPGCLCAGLPHCGTSERHAPKIKTLFPIGFATPFLG